MAASGLCGSRFERTLLDVRVFNPYAELAQIDLHHVDLPLCTNATRRRKDDIMRNVSGPWSRHFSFQWWCRRVTVEWWGRRHRHCTQGWPLFWQQRSPSSVVTSWPMFDVSCLSRYLGLVLHTQQRRKAVLAVTFKFHASERSSDSSIHYRIFYEQD